MRCLTAHIIKTQALLFKFYPTKNVCPCLQVSPSIFNCPGFVWMETNVLFTMAGAEIMVSVIVVADFSIVRRLKASITSTLALLD